jgi:hypothetical protein
MSFRFMWSLCRRTFGAARVHACTVTIFPGRSPKAFWAKDSQLRPVDVEVPFDDVRDRVHYGPPRVLLRPPQPLRQREHHLDELPLGVGQIRRVGPRWVWR